MNGLTKGPPAIGKPLAPFLLEFGPDFGDLWVGFSPIKVGPDLAELRVGLLSPFNSRLGGLAARVGALWR